MTENSSQSAGLPWRRPSSCVGDSHCLEVAVDDQAVYLRNSTMPDRLLRLSPSQFRSLLRWLQSSEAPS
jgi:uncharacterized protein DUF397